MEVRSVVFLFYTPIALTRQTLWVYDRWNQLLAGFQAIENRKVTLGNLA